MHRRPPEPPVPPRFRGDRSHSPRSRDLGRLHLRLEGVLAAHRRDTRVKRGGGQARRRTRAIHRHILGFLVELLTGLLEVTGLTAPGRRQLVARQIQAQERLDWLNSPENNFPASKFIVLPDLREYIQEYQPWETISVDSNSVNDPLEVPPTEPSSDQEEDERVPYVRHPVLQAAYDRLVARGELVEIPGTGEHQLTASGRERAVRETQSVPDLPERLRGGSRVSSSGPDPRSAASSKAKAPPKLPPTPKGYPRIVPSSATEVSSSSSSARIVPTAASSSLSSRINPVPTIVLDPPAVPKAAAIPKAVNLRVATPLGELPYGAELNGINNRLSFLPILSLDYHRVLDSVQLSRWNVLKNTSEGLCIRG